MKNLLYDGKEVEGFKIDGLNVYGKSGKKLTESDGKVTITVDGKRTRVSVDVLRNENYILTEWKHGGRNVYVPVTPNSERMSRMMEIEKMLETLKIPTDSLVKGMSLGQINRLVNGTITPQELKSIYPDNIYLFALCEIIVPNQGGGVKPFSFNEPTLLNFYAYMNNITLYLHSPRGTRLSTALAVISLHSLMFNGLDNEFVILSNGSDNSERLMGMIKELIQHSSNINPSDFVFTSGVIKHIPSGNSIATYLVDVDKSGLEARGKGLYQSLQLFDNFEFINGIDVLMKNSKCEKGTGKYNARILNSVYNRYIEPETLKYIEDIPSVMYITEAKEHYGPIHMKLNKEEITGYDYNQMMRLLISEEVQKSEVLLERIPVYTQEYIINNSSLNWTMGNNDTTASAVSLLDTCTLETVPDVIKEEIIADGVIPWSKVTKEIITLYSIRYVRAVLVDGVDLVKGYKYDDPDQILFAVFGTNSPDFINALIGSSTKLLESIIEAIKVLSSNKDIDRETLFKCIGCKTDNIILMNRIAKVSLQPSVE